MTHRSRTGWADPMDEEPSVHTCRLPRVVRLAMIGMVLAQLLTIVALGFSVAYDYQQQQYIEGRGEYRDREATRLEAGAEEQDRRTACRILDAFPAGGYLDAVRERFACGPGIPLDQLPADLRARITPSTPTPSSSTFPPRTGSGPGG
jgi:hypothetical protein